MIQLDLQTLGHVLLGQVPTISGKPISATASEHDARARLQTQLADEFRQRREGVNLCRYEAAGFVKSDNFLAMALPYVAKTALLMTVAGMMAAPPVGISAALWQAVATALSTTIDEGVDTIAGQIAAEAEAQREDKVWQIFHAQDQVINNLQKIAEDALNDNFSATYASLGSAAAANAACEQFRLELEDRTRHAYMDQYFESAGGFAAAIAQEKLGLFDPATWDNQPMSMERRGTDVFTSKPWPVSTKNARGVVYIENLDLYADKFEYDPETGEPTSGLPADWKPNYYLTAIPEGVWQGGLPDAMLSRLRKRNLAEWKLPIVVHGVGPYSLFANELGEIRVEGPLGRFDVDASRRVYEKVLKPALMRMN